jgi:molecular chaperone GrpE
MRVAVEKTACNQVTTMSDTNDTQKPKEQKGFLDDEHAHDEETDTDGDDIEIEAEDSEESDGDAQSKRKTAKLKQKLKKCKKEKKEYIDELQRRKAEFNNARKRDEEKKKEEIDNANERLILELLPVIDSFDMAFADKEAYEATPENWRKGVEYIYSQLMNTLESYGVQPIEPEKEPFDPAYHEAVEQVAISDPAYDQIVTDIVQRGYTLNDKVIRSAKVRVGATQSNQLSDSDKTA